MSAELHGLRLNPAGMRQFLRSREVQAALLAHAEQIAARARPLAPVRTGRLARSIDAEVVVESDRARAYVTAHTAYAAAVHGRSPYLTRAVDGG